MKLKYWIILLVFCIIIGVIGSWMKVLHKPYADSILIFSMILNVTVVFIVIRLTGKKNILNK